jgi:hypothetical protein
MMFESNDEAAWVVIGPLVQGAVLTLLLFSAYPLIRHYLWDPFLWPWLASRLEHMGFNNLVWVEEVEKREAPAPAPAPAPNALPPEPLAEAIRRLPRIVEMTDMLRWRPKSTTALPLGVGPDFQTVWLDLATEALHIGVYAQSGAGKDNLLRSWFLMLCARNKPQFIQFAFIDGKGDWLTPSLASSAHMFLPPAGGYGKKGDAAIQHAIQQIDAEAARRQTLITQANCTTREQYVARTGQDLPLLVVVATDVMSNVAGSVEELLVNLISKARSLGIRVIVSMQTPTGRDSRWRMNLSTVVAGPLQSGEQDRVALGIDVKDMRYRPSRLPDPQDRPGVFVVRKGQRQMLVQAPYVTEQIWESAMYAIPIRERLHQPVPEPEAEITWTADHIRVATWLAQQPALSVREVARRLNPGTDGSGSYSVQAKAIIEDVVTITAGRDMWELVPEYFRTKKAITGPVSSDTSDTDHSNGNTAHNEHTAMTSATNIGNNGKSNGTDNGTTGRNSKQATELSDEEIRELLAQGMSRRKIAENLRGSMQKRLARIEAVAKGNKT